MNNAASKTILTAITLFLLAVAATFIASSALAEEPSPLQNKFVISTDITVFGNYMVLNDRQSGEYSLVSKWQIPRSDQWLSVLKTFEELEQTDDFYNPFNEKDPDFILFVQSNPDQVSGEDVYFSKHGTILRVSRQAVDHLFVKGEELYSFLTEQMKYKNFSYSANNEDIDINKPGIVVVYRNSMSLNNPHWYVTNPEEIKVYKNLFSGLLLKNLNFSGSLSSTREGRYGFDAMHTFMIYTNYDGAGYKLLTVNEAGYVRGTSIKLNARGYADTPDYYNTFLRQAQEALKQSEDNAKRLEMRKKIKDF